MHFIQEFQIYRWFIKSGLNVKWRIYRILNPKLWKVKNKSPPPFFFRWGGGDMLLEVKRVAYITVYYHPAVTTLTETGGGGDAQITECTHDDVLF